MSFDNTDGMGRMLEASVAERKEHQGNSLSFAPVHIGMELFVEFQFKGGKEKVKTKLVGYSNGEFLIIKTPRIQGVSISNAKGLNALVVRYLHDGSVFGFQATLLRLIGPPFYVCFLSFPTKIEEISLRRNPRIAVVIPFEWDGKGDETDRILDLSANGSLLHLSKSVEYGDTINISFVLPDGMAVTDLKCTIRRIEASSDRVLAGVEFDPEDVQLAHIENYLKVVQVTLGM